MAQTARRTPRSFYPRGATVALVAMWCVGGVSLAGVVALQQRADARRQAQLVLNEIRTHVDGLGQITFDAHPGRSGTSVIVVRARLLGAHRQIDGEVGLVGRLAPDPAQRRLGDQIAAFFAVIARTLPLLTGGDVQQATARFAAAYQRGGSEYAIKRALAARDAHAQRDSDQARLLSYVGSALAMLITLLGFSLVLRRAVRAGRRAIQARERAETLTAENERLLEQSRVEAVTDPLTGLGNRRKLFMDARDADLESPEGASVIGLFDLDGFKLYNDTFGHPAGDALLTRLSHRLTAAVKGKATAYRMGGDEFCVLANAVNDGHELLRTAQAALSDHGDGFSIRCSRGEATIPQDAKTVEQALQLADDRLYTDKRQARTGEGRDVRDAVKRLLSEDSAELTCHSSTVATLAVATAQRLGLTPNEVTSLRLAAELHDIGKAAIPQAILDKTGPLDEDERDFVRRHSVVGERIIAAAPELAKIAPIVRSSHERADGQGYPDGLAADQIPLGSRIIAVVDAFDAMTHARAYHPARTPRQAIAELRKYAGTQFDGNVVAAFIAALEAAEHGSPVAKLASRQPAPSQSPGEARAVSPAP